MAVTLPQVTGEFGENPVLTFPESPAPSGLHVSVLKEGTGPTIQAGREIEVNYHGQIWGGGIFDSSFLRGAPASFPIGVGMVIQGWDQGLLGMKVGGRRRLEIPSHLAYGERGAPGAIAPNEALIFVVDLMGTK